MKELNESAALSSFRMKYELGRSFDLEDDLEFCPGLVTESDVSDAQDDLDLDPIPAGLCSFEYAMVG
jgi:hypothetical protein